MFWLRHSTEWKGEEVFNATIYKYFPEVKGMSPHSKASTVCV